MVAPASTNDNLTADQVDYDTLPGFGPNVRPFAGIRNRRVITASKSSDLPKERPPFPRRQKDVPVWHYASGTPRPDGAVRTTLGKVHAGRQFLKDKRHDAERKLRLRGIDEKADILPITDEDADYFVTGKIKHTPGRPSAWSAYKDSGFGKRFNKFVATSAQLLLSNYYTMFGYAHEFFYFYLYQGWYQFFLKTLVMKELLGAPFRLVKRIVNGPDRLTEEQKAAKKELQLRKPSLQIWHESAQHIIRENNRPLTDEEYALRRPTMERIRLRRDGPPPDPDAPRHADIPDIPDPDGPAGAADGEVRRQQYAGAGAATPRPVVVEDPPRVPPPAPWDPNRNRRRRSRNGGRGI